MLGLLALAAVDAWAHKFHASLIEAVYNREAGAIEMIVRVFADDLERGVGERRGARYRLGEDEAPVFDYIRARVQFRGEAGDVLPMTWVGMESDVRQVWAYIEIPVEESRLGQLTIANRLFLELFDDQVNTLNLVVGEDKTTLLFRSGEESQTFRRRAR